MSCPSRPAPLAASIADSGGFYCRRHSAGSQRIFAANIEIAACASGRERRDRHSFQDGKRITFHQEPVLERAGLGFIGVTDDIMGTPGRMGDRLPFSSGGKSRTSPPKQLRGDDFRNHSFRPQFDRPPQRSIAAFPSIGLETFRVGSPDSPEEAKAGLTRLGNGPP